MWVILHTDDNFHVNLSDPRLVPKTTFWSKDFLKLLKMLRFLFWKKILTKCLKMNKKTLHRRIMSFPDTLKHSFGLFLQAVMIPHHVMADGSWLLNLESLGFRNLKKIEWFVQEMSQYTMQMIVE